MISETMTEDLIANGLLGFLLIGVACMRDFCKRVSHSDCIYNSEEGGLKIKLPTWRSNETEV